MEALMEYLKSCSIDAELVDLNIKIPNKKSEFNLSVGIWKDYNIDANEL